MISRARYLCAVIGAAAGLAFPVSGLAETPRVVATIPPLHALVSAVMGDSGDPYLLIDKRSSPHELNLRPSQARALARADLVVWIGPELEAPLARSLKATRRGKSLRVLGIPGLVRHGARPGGAWHDHEHHEHESDGHAEGTLDPHVWLSPRNADLIGYAVAESLAELDPPNAGAYRRNADLLSQRLSDLKKDINAVITEHGEKPFIVLHDSLQYFEHAFKLNNAGAVTTASAKGAGARTLRELKELVDASGIRCIVADPYVSKAFARTLVEGNDANTAEIDPLGYSHAPGKHRYDAMMRDIAGRLAACLAP